MRRRLAIGLFASLLIMAVVPQVSAQVDEPGGVPGDPLVVTDSGELAHNGLITSDGASLIYIKGQWASNQELMIRPLRGGGPVSLSGPVAGGWIVRALLSPQADRVVYLADHEVEDRVELYSVPVAGGQPTKLSGPMVSGGDIEWWRVTFTPDGSQVVYLADADTDNTLELFVAPVDGGAPAKKLHADYPSGGGVTNIALTPDGSHVIYSGRPKSSGPSRLYKAPLDGSGAARISPAGAAVTRFALTGDGTKVIWSGRTQADGKGVFVVSVDGGDYINLSGPMVAKGEPFRLFPTGDDQHVVYTADQEVDGRIDLYAAALDGSTHRRLSPPSERGVGSVAVSPTGTQVLFSVFVESGQTGMFWGDAATGSASKIGPELTGRSLSQLSFVPNGEYAVFAASTGPTGQVRLYRVEAATGDVAQLARGRRFIDVSGDLALLEDRLWFTADSSRVLVAATTPNHPESALFSIHVERGNAIELSGDVVTGIRHFQLSPSSTHSVFLDDGRYHVSTVRHHRCAGKRATHAGTAGDDIISGSAGRDVIVAFGGDDTVLAGGRADLVCGGTGRDVLVGGPGPDRLLGGASRDTLRGSGGDDTLDGQRGADALYGLGGNDLLRGGSGPDSLYGGDADDVMRGGPDLDSCDGGAGADVAISCRATNVP